MKTSSSILLLTMLSLLLSACGEAQTTNTSESQSDSLQAMGAQDGMMRIDKGMVDSMNAADSSAARGGASATQANPTGRALWLGALLTPRDGNVTVMAVVAPVAGVDLKQGDVIEAVNGTVVNTPQEVKKQYSFVAVGQPVRLKARRGGKERTLTFARPDTSGVPSLKMRTVQ